MDPPPRPSVAPPVPRFPTGPRPAPAVLARLQRSPLFRDFQRAFETSTGLPLVLRAAGSFRPPLEGSRRANPFCTRLTHANESCAACLQLQQRLETEATLLPKTRRCHAGLSESVVPVRIGGAVLGYLQTGQVFLRAPTNATFAAAGRPAFRADYFRTRVVPRNQYDAAIRLLAIFAEQLAAVCHQTLTRAATDEAPGITKGRAYIGEHLGETLRLGDVAQFAGMSSCYFCKVFRRTTGLTFTEFVARERIEFVKRSLLNIHRRISEAAFAAGFQSLSQFNRVFRRIAGEPPRRYRARIHGLSGATLRRAA